MKRNLNNVNMTLGGDGYTYDKRGGRKYKRTCRNYHVYDARYLKVNDKSIFKKLGVLIHVLNYFATFVVAAMIAMEYFNLGILASLGVGLAAYLVTAVAMFSEDFVGEYACKAQGLFTGVWVGYLVQWLGFKCQTFSELMATGNLWKAALVYVSVSLIGYICLSSFWKSYAWDVENPHHFGHFLNCRLQETREKRIEKEEKMLQNVG